MSIAEDYFADAGETVGQACRRLHAAGWGVNHVSRLIGYGSSTELRRYLQRRAIECPWPVKPRGKSRGRPPITLTYERLSEYVTLVVGGLTTLKAAERVGSAPSTMRIAMRTRHPELLVQLDAARDANRAEKPNKNWRRRQDQVALRFGKPFWEVIQDLADEGLSKVKIAQRIGWMHSNGYRNLIQLIHRHPDAVKWPVVRSVPETYRHLTGESFPDAVRRLAAEGRTLTQAAHHIGYTSSSSLRFGMQSYGLDVEFQRAGART